jgi:DNA repair exonuclease SbcCD ATPase subunit
MAYYDEQLQLLQQQMARKNHEETKLKQLYIQREELSAKVYELKKSKLEQQKDVDQLEGGSLSSFFYAIIGKREEKLDKEREEAYAARVKYDVASRELSAVEEDIARIETELRLLGASEKQYEKMLKSKVEAIKSTESQEAVEIFETEKRISFIESQRKEIEEALSAGEKALTITNRILSNINSAKSWGTWDLMGGGLISGMAKHSHLDEAQNQVEDLQIQLRRFKTELTDVKINSDVQVSIDGFLGFADYFFDGLFADWAVLNRINESLSQVQNTKKQIESVLSHLRTIDTSSKAELERERMNLNVLIKGVKM